jgi:hypothetical protein
MCGEVAGHRTCSWRLSKERDDVRFIRTKDVLDPFLSSTIVCAYHKEVEEIRRGLEGGTRGPVLIKWVRELLQDREERARSRDDTRRDAHLGGSWAEGTTGEGENAALRAKVEELTAEVRMLRAETQRDRS